MACLLPSSPAVRETDLWRPVWKLSENTRFDEFPDTLIAGRDDGQADLIIDYAAALHRGEPISTATTESTVQRLLHRRMSANQQMRWSPRSAHRMLKVRTAAMNGTLASDHTAAEPYARRPFRRAA